MKLFDIDDIKRFISQGKGTKELVLHWEAVFDENTVIYTSPIRIMYEIETLKKYTEQDFDKFAYCMSVEDYIYDELTKGE